VEPRLGDRPGPLAFAIEVSHCHKTGALPASAVARLEAPIAVAAATEMSLESKLATARSTAVRHWTVAPPRRRTTTRPPRSAPAGTHRRLPSSTGTSLESQSWPSPDPPASPLNRHVPPIGRSAGLLNLSVGDKRYVWAARDLKRPTIKIRFFFVSVATSRPTGAGDCADRKGGARSTSNSSSEAPASSAMRCTYQNRDSSRLVYTLVGNFRPNGLGFPPKGTG